MKRNLYLSYINDESMNFRNKIIDNFKGRKYKHSDETYTTAQTQLGNKSEELIKIRKSVSRMDVTIVLISRSILDSSWIPKEIEYSLNVVSDSKTQPKPKGVIGVVIPDKGNDYSYMMKKGLKGIWKADTSKLPSIISSNIHNEIVVQNKNNVHYDSYISIYRWEDFIVDVESCVNSAYDKATNYFDDYNITLK
jgi:hypothetical protein